ncbi:DUF4158 domain-containing protein [Nonomuraea pusilla]|uniref:DUF4158 domain-containing protein n=1 Tax=Nonomuraea pusilla TaxID=46177 RepID=UPI00342670DA
MKSCQRLGYVPKVEDVPLLVVRHVSDVLGLGEDVALEREAVRSAKRHREFVRKRMKVVYDGAGARKVATDAIRRAVLTKDNPADLINVALEELVRARCELPGYTTLDAMAATIRTEVNNGFYQSVAGQVQPASGAAGGYRRDRTDRDVAGRRATREDRSFRWGGVGSPTSPT